MQRKLWRDGTVLHCGDELVVELGGIFARVRGGDWESGACDGGGLGAGGGGISGGDCAVKVGGIVSAPTVPGNAVDGLRYFVGGHPIPNRGELAGGGSDFGRIASVRRADAGVFSAVGRRVGAGGVAARSGGRRLEDVQGLYSALVTCGAPIADLGKVRRHLSAVKGGRLAVAAGRATKITLAVSDVPKRQEAALASGPTIPDPTTIADAMDVIDEV